MSDQPADQIRKLVTMAALGTGPEADNARVMARKAIEGLDTELLDTLAGQRKRLLIELREESSRLNSSRERATKTETGELVSRALLLLRHYERYDALIAAIMWMRTEDGRLLTNEERQQLDGPVEDMLDRVLAGRRERQVQQREERRAAARRRREERSRG